MASAYAAPHDAALVAESGALLGPPRPRISWSAVLAGAMLAMAIEVLLGLLGAGIGLATVQPGSATTTDVSNFATNAGLWSLGSSLLALLIGGWTAARLAAVVSRKDGMLHGLVIWSLALLVALYLAAAAIGGALSLLGGLASSAGGGLRAVAPQMSAPQMSALNADVGQQARALLQPPQSSDPGAMSAEDAQKEVARMLPDLAAGGDRATQARGRIADIMAAQLKISRDDAARRLDEARAKLAQSAQTAAGQGAEMASRASLVAFVGLLLGALAAGIGGALARPRVQRANRLR
jgi:hypothetical protein